MINPPLHIGFPYLPGHEFFYQNFSSATSFSQNEDSKDAWTLSYLVDRLSGLIKLPFIIQDWQELRQMIRRGATLLASSDLRLQSLSLLANVTELLVWLGERDYMRLAKRDVTILNGICSLFTYLDLICSSKHITYTLFF